MVIITRIKRALVVSVALAFAGLGIAPAQSSALTASFSVLHVATADAETAELDVYAGDMRILRKLRSGDLRGVRITPGEYDVAITRAGDSPTNALLKLDNVALPKNSNLTVAVHTDPLGALRATPFDNTFLRNPTGMGRLTIRHIATAPEVDVQLDNETLVLSLGNQQEASQTVPAGTRALRLVLSGDGDRVLSERAVAINRPVNTIVYLWGSPDEGLRVSAQRMPRGQSR